MTKPEQTATKIKSPILIGLRGTNQNVGASVATLVCEQSLQLEENELAIPGGRERDTRRQRENDYPGGTGVLCVAEVWTCPLIFIYWNNHQCDSADR